MFEIIATQETVLKSSPSPSALLTAGQKATIKKGDRLPVARFSIEGKHYRIVLDKVNGQQLNIQGRNTWYIYQGHSILHQAGKPVVDSKVIDYVPQPNVFTCQSAAIARVLGTKDVMGIRSALEAKGAPGDPYVMGDYLEPRVKEYLFYPNASLNQAVDFLDKGYQLITHGWFTDSGHVIGISGYKADPKTLGIYFNAEDPYYEFDFSSWSYTRKSGDDVQYSSYGIYASCVASAGVGHARQIYSRKELDMNRTGMWLHVIKN